ncbi:LuxR family transcriptional regulator [Streptomyces sp. MNP-20]|uniref:helix-turn-helix transcriptional regulator n=1 Tax=Streptomyces sp. MNP-20 TaxID=2721165 RepID=UPI00155443B5|nr:LuxR family transcriptional regulator [Streptomyces sp. MNP-20]
MSNDRKETVEHLWTALGTTTDTAVQFVRGEVGSGRTTVLDALAERLGAAGTPAHRITCLPGDHLTPRLLAHRLVLALSRPAPADCAEPDGRPSPEASNPRASSSESALGLLDKALRTRGPTVVLIDDAQHADPETVSLLRSLLPRFPALRLVLSVAPVRSGWPAEQQDERAGLAPLSDCVARVVDLPPLTRDDIARMLTTRLRAVPDESLVTELHRVSGGNPAAAEAAIGPAESRVRVLIGHAHLVEGAPPRVLPEDDRFLRTLRGLGSVVWRVAKALSLLEHLGPTATRLIETATGLPGSTVKEALNQLVHHGFVAGPDGSGTDRPSGPRFRIPLVSVAVRARLGPYERRVASAAAVHALWHADATGPAGPAGEGRAETAAALAYLADRIVDAGALVDRERAARDLFRIAERLRTSHRRRAAGWLWAAVELAGDPAPYASTVIGFVTEALGVGDHQAAARSAGALARVDVRELDTITRYTLLAVELTRLASTGDIDQLCTRYQVLAAEAERGSAVPAVMAACLLGRWSDVRDLMARTEQDTHANVPARSFGRLLATKASLMGGDSAALYRELQETDIAFPPFLDTFGITVHQCESLLTIGDLKGAEALLDSRGMTAAELPRQAEFLLRFLRGAWPDALSTARWLMANDLPTSRIPLGVLVHAKASTILLAQGWPARARTVLDTARALPAPMAYLMDAEEAAIHRFFGRADAERETLRRGLAEAAAHGCAVGTGPLWSAMAILEAAQGRPDAAVTCLRALRRSASAGDDRACLLYLRARVETVRLCHELRARLLDSASDQIGAVELARSLGQPYETARTLLAVAMAEPRVTSSREALLREAYALFGQVDAQLWRHWTRIALRSAGLRVPEPRGSAREMDLLMARLVAEGLSNRQLAATLSLSETGVSSRLNRLFRRTGLRSRVELTTAVATGDPLFRLHEDHGQER